MNGILLLQKHKCDVCAKIFSQLSSLNGHMAVHTKERMKASSSHEGSPAPGSNKGKDSACASAAASRSTSPVPETSTANNEITSSVGEHNPPTSNCESPVNTISSSAATSVGESTVTSSTESSSLSVPSSLVPPASPTVSSTSLNSGDGSSSTSHADDKTNPENECVGNSTVPDAEVLNKDPGSDASKPGDNVSSTPLDAAEALASVNTCSNNSNCEAPRKKMKTSHPSEESSVQVNGYMKSSDNSETNSTKSDECDKTSANDVDCKNKTPSSEVPDSLCNGTHSSNLEKDNKADIEIKPEPLDVDDKDTKEEKVSPVDDIKEEPEEEELVKTDPWSDHDPSKFLPPAGEFELVATSVEELRKLVLQFGDLPAKSAKPEVKKKGMEDGEADDNENKEYKDSSESENDQEEDDKPVSSHYHVCSSLDRSESTICSSF